MMINNFSYYAFKSNPFLGVGFGNYSQITLDDIKPYVIADKGVFNLNLYSTASHAHNVFFNYLISGGLLIFSIFSHDLGAAADKFTGPSSVISMSSSIRIPISHHLGSHGLPLGT